jgi:hypothetical protein
VPSRVIDLRQPIAYTVWMIAYHAKSLESRAPLARCASKRASNHGRWTRPIECSRLSSKKAGGSCQNHTYYYMYFGRGDDLPVTHSRAVAWGGSGIRSLENRPRNLRSLFICNASLRMLVWTAVEDPSRREIQPIPDDEQIDMYEEAPIVHGKVSNPSSYMMNAAFAQTYRDVLCCLQAHSRKYHSTMD